MIFQRAVHRICATLGVFEATGVAPDLGGTDSFGGELAREFPEDGAHRGPTGAQEWVRHPPPMLDDRNVTLASREITDPRVWNREANLFGWRSYLGAAGGEGVPQYAAATRATDLSSLPPAYVAVGTMDLFVDEDIEYVQRLIQAGVPTELHVYPGAFHGLDMLAPDAALSKKFIADREEALRKALHL